VGQDARTTNGDIKLEASTILGDIIFDDFSSSWGDSRPTLTIDEYSRVEGDIYLRREVKLRISDGAAIGEIIRDY
jgi:hypothetical protein